MPLDPVVTTECTLPFMKDKLLAIGVTGSAIAAICCFTPFLAIALPAVGLGGFVGYLYNEAVLLPALAVFVLITGVALWRRKKTG